MNRQERRQFVRSVARSVWIDCEGDIEACRIEFRKHHAIVTIDLATVIVLLQIAMLLWRWWSERGIAEPSVVASSDEPGMNDDD